MQRPSREQTPFFWTYDHASATADTTIKLWKNTSGQQLRIDRVEYINPTGLAGSASNAFNIKLMQAAVVIANWDTDSDVVGQGTIAANTWIQLANSATDADLVIEDGEEIAVFFDEGGDTTLPAGRLQVKGRFI